jgi:hypothetical protein
MRRVNMYLALFGLSLGLLCTQVPLAANPPPQSVQSSTDSSMPVYHVTLIERTMKAINYQHRGGATKIDFRGTELQPKARGEAKVESKKGYLEIEVEFDDMQPATRYGAEYLTYVLWAITPEGRTSNLGEVLLNGGTKSKLDVTTELQVFGLAVTAEPYFAVTFPVDITLPNDANHAHASRDPCPARSGRFRGETLRSGSSNLIPTAFCGRLRGASPAIHPIARHVAPGSLLPGAAPAHPARCSHPLRLL